MPKLIVERNQLNYIGIFSNPAFELWGEGQKMFQGLFTIFRPYGVKLSNLHNSSSSLDPADQELGVNVASVLCRFKFDRIECTRSDATEEDIADFPSLLGRCDEWLRSEMSDFSFSSHLFTYFAHTRIEGATSREVLRSLSTMDIKDLGETRGAGLIFRYDLVEKDWELQFTIDHSLLVGDGLFVQFSILSKADKQDYLDVLLTGRRLLEKALATMGLEFHDQL